MSDDSTNYDPRSNAGRVGLTQELLALFDRAVFVEVSIEGTKERVFAREVPDTDGKVRVLVYSSIEGNMTRKCGDDAIRVCAVYKARDGRERGIASAEKRVNRVGTVEAIAERVIDRMRQVWKATKTAERCPKCGAPMFKAKSGKLCCADLCWKGNNLNDGWQPRQNRSYGRRGRTFSHW